MSIKLISTLLILFVVVLVGLYGWLVISASWPIQMIPIDKIGVFGDSFGVLTSLFSGLAFSGLIITILLQREELRLQRAELKASRLQYSKSATAQTHTAQLSALSSVLGEYTSQIDKYDQKIERMFDRGNRQGIPIRMPSIHGEEEHQDLIRRKNLVVAEIEKILRENNINID